MPGWQVALGDGEEAGQPRLGRQEVVAIGIQRRSGNDESDRQQLPLLVEEKAELHRHRHGAERILQHDQPGVARSDGLRRRRQISSMRVDRGEARLRPIQEVRSAAVAALERDRACDIDEDRRLAGEFRQLRRERVVGKGCAFERLGHGRKRVFELARRDRLSSAPTTQVDGLLRRSARARRRFRLDAMRRASTIAAIPGRRWRPR